MIPIWTEDSAFVKGMKESMCYALEDCIFCNNPTNTWHEDTNNPVCISCAKTHNVSDIKNDFGEKIRQQKKDGTFDRGDAQLVDLSVEEDVASTENVDKVFTETVSVSMDGVRKNLVRDANGLQEALGDILGELHKDHVDEIVDKFNAIACSLNSLNCLHVPNIDGFSNLEDDTEVELLDCENY